MAKSPSEILEDPQFFRLPPEERLKVMRTVDPNFAALPQEDQNNVLTRSVQRLFQQDPEKTAQTFMTPEQRQAYQKTGQIIQQREQQTAAEKAAEDKGDPGFWGTMKTLGQGLVMTPAFETLRAMQHPVEPYKQDIQRAKENLQTRWGQMKESGLSLLTGHPVQGAVQALSAAVPGGPAALEAAEQRAKGHYGTATAEAIGLVGPSLVGMGYEALPTRGPKPAGGPIPPVRQRAISALEREGVPLSMGQKYQDPYLLEIERNLTSVEGPARKIANDFYSGQRQRLAEALASNARRVGPAATSDAQSVRELFGQLDRRIETGFQSANRQYDALRAEAAQHPVKVQVGTREVPGPRPEATLTPAGMPRTVPVEKTFEMPVSLQPFRDDLNSVYENILETMPEGQRAYSRGFQVLKEVATSDQKYMSALAFDKFLSAMKGFLRDGNSELLTKSQGLAKRMITAGEKQLDETFDRFSPDMKKRLQAARDTVREYHRVDELRTSLPTEPGQAFQQLTAKKDAYADRLRELQKLAPQQIQTVARMWFEGWMENVTEVGGVTRTEGLFRALRNLGPETRKILFGDQAQQLMDMALGSKMVAGAEGSPTGRRVAAWKQWLNKNQHGTVGGFLGVLAAGMAGGGHWEGAGLATAALGTYEGGRRLFGPAWQRHRAKVWAEMLFQPGTPKLVRQAMNSTVGSPVFRTAIEALNARSILAERRAREDQAVGAAQPTGTGGGRGAPQTVPPTGGGRGAPRAAASGLTPQIHGLLAKASRQYGVPLDMLTHVASRETGGLRDPATAVSPKGAVGVMQLMPSTAADYGLRESDLTDPAKSIDTGARILRDLLKRYNGDRTLALAAYNAGPGAVEKYGGVPPYKETQNYVQGAR